jgi:hypothetical protein
VVILYGVLLVTLIIGSHNSSGGSTLGLLYSVLLVTLKTENHSGSSGLWCNLVVLNSDIFVCVTIITDHSSGD